ncbi:MAG TPA: hypothetical protein VFH80_06360 [Solirubrobacteraceae bacterium]|nr:hypothetical protein [Solirubrobacteraceae bacterium]
MAGISATSPTSASEAVQAALAPIRPEGFFGGARLLAADARVVSLLADDARRRTMERMFGIPRDQKSGLVTLIALGAVGSALQSRVPGRPSRPGVSGTTFGFGMLLEAAYRLGGPEARESSNFATLLALALAGAGARVAVRKTVHGVRGVSHQAYAEFHHRYGHLIRPNRRRAGAEPGPRERGSLPISDM